MGTHNVVRRDILRQLAATGLGAPAAFAFGATMVGQTDPRQAATSMSPVALLSAANRVFDVRDFGAVGDGESDESSSIQSALDEAHAAGGGIVWITPGRYKLSSPIIVRANTTIWAYSAHLFGDGTGGLLKNFSAAGTGYAGEGNIAVLGGVWDARAQLAQVDEMHNSLYFAWARGIVVRDLTVRNTISAHAIELKSVDGAVIDSCRFEGFRDTLPGPSPNRQYSEAVQLDRTDNTVSDSHTKNVVISNCYAGPAIDGSGLGSFGAGFGSHTGAKDGYFENIRIVDNVAEGCLRYGIRLFDYRHAVVSGNVIRNCGPGAGIFIEVSNPAIGDPVDADGINTLRDIQISMNVIESVGDQGIQVLGRDGGAKVEAISIFGNVIRNTAGTGMTIEFAAGCKVNGNTISDSAGTGIYYANCSDVTVSDNTVINAGGHAISFNTSPQSLVSGNKIYSPDASGVRCATSPSTLISNNTVDATGSNGIYLYQSPRSIVQGNRVLAPAGDYGIAASTSSHHCLIGGNLVTCNAATSPATAAPKKGALAVSATSNNCLFTTNIVRDGTSGVPAMYDSGSSTGTTCVHNDFTGYGSTAGVITSSVRKVIAVDPNLGANLP